MAREEAPQLVLRWEPQYDLHRFAEPRVCERTQRFRGTQDRFVVHRRTGIARDGAFYLRYTVHRLTYYHDPLRRVCGYVGRVATLTVLTRISRRWREAIAQADEVTIASWSWIDGPWRGTPIRSDA